MILPSAAHAALPQAKTYDGVITQINLIDGSFTMRMRDGSLVAVANPLGAELFLSVKGILDPAGKTLTDVTEMKVKNKNGADAIPNIALLDPGAAQVGSQITLAGTGFTRKNNAVSIGSVKNAVIGLASRDGKTLTFRFPPTPCDKKAKAVCAQRVLDSGVYDIAVTNANGVSNSLPFQVTPLPPLSITTETLPQIMGWTRFNGAVSGLGGAEAYIWRISDGKLPPGLMLAQGACKETPCKADAKIFGTPTVPGTYPFTLTLSSGQEIISRQFTLTVVQPLNNPY